MTKTKVYILDASKVRSYTDQLTRSVLERFHNGSWEMKIAWEYHKGCLSAGEIRQTYAEELHTAVYEMISCGIEHHARKVNDHGVFALHLNMQSAWKEMT